MRTLHTVTLYVHCLGRGIRPSSCWAARRGHAWLARYSAPVSAWRQHRIPRGLCDTNRWTLCLLVAKRREKCFTHVSCQLLSAGGRWINETEFEPMVGRYWPGKAQYSHKGLSQCVFVHQNPTWIGLTSNPDFRSERPVTKPPRPRWILQRCEGNSDVPLLIYAPRHGARWRSTVLAWCVRNYGSEWDE